MTMRQVSPTPSRRAIATLVIIGIVAIAYWLAAQVALQYVSLPGGITPIWPSSGIALAAVFLFGNRIAPGICLGVLLLAVTHDDPLSQVDMGIEFINAISISLESIITAWVLRQILLDRNPLMRSHDSFRFVLVAFMAPIFSASVGSLATCLAGADPWSDFIAIWFGWWISNAFGIWIVTPSLLSWYAWYQEQPRFVWPSRSSLVEGSVIFLTTVIVSQLVFQQSLPLEYTLIPILIWTTFRFGHAFAMALVIVVSAIAIVGTGDGLGPFVNESRPESLALLLLQAFIGVATLTVLVLSAVIAERQSAKVQLVRANEALAELTAKLQASNLALEDANSDLELRVEQRTQDLSYSEDKFSKAFRSSPNPIIISRLTDGCILDVNDSFVKLSGYQREDVIHQYASTIGIWVNPGLRERLIHQLRTQGAVRDYEADFRIQSGEVRVGLLSAEIIVLAGQECLLSCVNDITERKRAEAALKAEQEKSERLLLNILPYEIAEQLKQREQQASLSEAIAEHFDEVSILFADLVGFTPLSEQLGPIDLVNLLNRVFSTFDQLAERFELEKIKTIGDAYMVASGLPTPRADHAEAIANMALAMRDAMQTFQNQLGKPLRLRIGINSGIVVAGVIGKKKFIYDLWGDAVNIASRMESLGEPGNIQVTEETYQRLKDRYQFQERGMISVKGKGEMKTYWLLGQKASPNSDRTQIAEAKSQI
jgi:PAS domain S-box-containing protein